MTIREALSYEIDASPWASYMTWGWARDLTSRWFAFKVRRKWARHVLAIERARIVAEFRNRDSAQKELPAGPKPSET